MDISNGNTALEVVQRKHSFYSMAYSGVQYEAAEIDMVIVIRRGNAIDTRFVRHKTNHPIHELVWFPHNII